MKPGTDYIGVSVGAMIINNNHEVLLCKRSQNAGNERGSWENPGGKVHFGETLEIAMRREIKEEIDCEVEIIAQYAADDHIIQSENQHWVATSFVVRIKNGSIPKIMEPTKCDEIKWFQMNGLPTPLSIITKHDLKRFQSSAETHLPALSGCNVSLPIDTYFKDFESWNKKKQSLHNKIKPSPLFKQGDVWWTSIGINIGYEQDGKHDKFIRPVLVIRKFNKELFLGVPLSTKIKNNPYYIPITIKGETVSAITSQLRVYSSKRFQDKLVDLDSEDFNKVQKEVGKMILFSPPSRRQRSRG